jgi:hypothetical protein
MSGGPKLRKHRAVDIVDQRMDHRLPMQDDLDPVMRRSGTIAPPRSVRAPCSSSSPNRSKSSPPSTSWDARPPVPGVTPRICSIDQSRNGPPLAVRMIRRTPSGGRNRSIGRSHCARNRPATESRRSVRPPRGRPRRPKPAAPCWRGPRCRPASTAAITGSSPAQPTIAAIVQVGTHRRGLEHSACDNRRRRDARTRKRVAQRGQAAFVRHHARIAHWSGSPPRRAFRHRNWRSAP